MEIKPNTSVLIKCMITMFDKKSIITELLPDFWK